MTHYTNTSNPVDFPVATSKASALIEELALQANAWYPGGYPSAEGGDEAWKNLVIFDKQDLKKFTELIVNKCIEAAGDPGDGMIKGNTWHDGIRAAIWSIKHEFGIDEN